MQWADGSIQPLLESTVAQLLLCYFCSDDAALPLFDERAELQVAFEPPRRWRSNRYHSWPGSGWNRGAAVQQAHDGFAKALDHKLLALTEAARLLNTLDGAMKVSSLLAR